ncbi:MAG: hypothetical protein IJ168_08025 [Eubacterium sp.]|nr:hypothetical protein [Eubacterium sp.]
MNREYQTALGGFVTCEQCYYGRDLGGGAYGCRSERRRELNRTKPSNTMVNRKDFTCEYAEAKYV